MKHLHRTPRRRGRRVTAGLAASALVAGLVATTTLATAAPGDGEGDVHGWGSAAGESWTLDLDNTQGPFVDVAVDSTGSGEGHTTLAVTSGGDIVTDGDANGVVSTMPSSLSTKNVVAVDIFEGRAAAVTDQGEIVTWNGTPAPSAQCVSQASSIGVRDIQISWTANSGGKDHGIVLLADGSVCAWSTDTAFNVSMPALEDVVKVQINRQSAAALTADGGVHAWGVNNTLWGPVSPEIEQATIVDISMSQYTGQALTAEGEILRFGNTTATGTAFPTDHEAAGQVIALSETASSDKGYGAATDRGEFITWGSGVAATSPAPADLQGREVVAMETAPDSHHVVILGEELDLPDPIAATGPPTIEGVPTVGEQLTATPAEFAPAEGVTTTHQWYATESGGEPVLLDGEDGTSLTLTSEHLGRTITYTTTGHRGDDEPVVSEPSNAVGPVVDEEPEVLEVETNPAIALEDGTDEPRVGVTIEATPAEFNQTGGLTIEHRWFRDGTRIEGADTSTYTLVADDIGGSITYATHATRVSDEQTATSAESNAVGPVLSVALEFTQAPAVDGNTYVGSEHTVVPGVTTDDENATSTYEWAVTFDDGRDPITAEGETFTPTEEHLGGTITVTQTATRGDDVVSEESEAFGPIREEPAELTVVEAATIEGSPYIGDEIVGTPATFSETEGVDVQHQWVVNFGSAEPIPAEIGPDGKARLTLTEQDKGKYFHFESIATRAGYSEPSGISRSATWIGAVKVRLVAVSDPEISGTTRSGSELTVSKDAVFSDPPPASSVSYHWFAGETEIKTGKSLMLTDDHVGQQITVVARAVRGADRAEARSEPTPAIRPAPGVVTVVTEATIEGGRYVGDVIVGTPATFSETEDVTVEHFWVVNVGSGTPIPAEIDSDGKARLELTTDHANQYFQFQSVATWSGAPEPAAVSTSPVTNLVGPVMVRLVAENDPTIAGTARVGETLTVGDDAVFSVMPPGASVQYFWLVGEEQVGTGRSLQLTESHVGREITLEARATRLPGELATARSEPTAPVQLETPLEIDEQAQLDDTARVGVELTATPATFSESEGVQIEHRWFADGELIEGATGTSFTPRETDLGLAIGYQTVATRTVDKMVVESDIVETEPVLVILAATAPPEITGSPEVGKTLVGTPATFNDTEGVTITHQWFADGEAIDGATASVLELTEDHLGAAITFASTATRGDEAPVVSVSEATAPVEPADTTPPGGEVVIDLDGPTPPGSTISVNVGTALAGQEVQLYLSNLDRMLNPATVAEDGTIQVLVPGDIQLGTHRLAVYADGDLVGWDDFEVTLVRPEDPAFKDLIDVTPDTVKAGDEVTIQVGADRAGQKVRVVLFSAPTDLGFATVAADGTVRVTIPADMADGVHRVAVYDIDGNLIGWQDITVTDGTGAGTGNGGRFGGLPGTGAEATGVMVPLGLAFLLAGLGLVIYRRRHQLS